MARNRAHQTHRPRPARTTPRRVPRATQQPRLPRPIHVSDHPRAQQAHADPGAALTDLDAHHGQPRPSSHQPDHTPPGPNPTQLRRDRRRTRHPPPL